jgi:hypothetical protein
MKKKILIGAVGALLLVLILVSNQSEITSIESLSYSQRLDSGDVVSLSYPKDLRATYYPDIPELGIAAVAPSSTSGMIAHVNALKFFTRDGFDVINITQNLPVSSGSKELRDAQEAWVARAPSEPKISNWRIGSSTAYEVAESAHRSFDFIVNKRPLSISFNKYNSDQVDEIMSTLSVNGVKAEKFTSMDNWDWPEMK